MTIHSIALCFKLQSIGVIDLFTVCHKSGLFNYATLPIMCLVLSVMSPCQCLPCFVSVRLLELLLRLGADPNLGDEYTTYYAIAREQRFDPMSGEREKLKSISLPANCAHFLFIL